MRQIISLDATVTNANLPDVVIPAEETALAALSGLVFWPAMESWALTSDSQGFKDKLDGQNWMSAGLSDLSDNFSVAVDGGISFRTTGPSDIIIGSGFDFSKGLTVGVLCGTECGIGSTTVDTGKWFFGSNLLKLRWEGGGTGFSTYDVYDGPLLSDTELNTVVFIVDVENRVAKARVNGVECLVDTTLDFGALFLGELQFGGVNVGTPQNRVGPYRTAVAFDRPLGATGIAALESYLNSKKYTV